MDFDELQFDLFWILQATQADKKIVETIFGNPFFKDQVQINFISVQLHKRSFVISVFWRIKYALCTYVKNIIDPFTLQKFANLIW